MSQHGSGGGEMMTTDAIKSRPDAVQRQDLSPRVRRWIRIGFAGPGAVVVALVVMAGMSLWLPKGAAGIDHLVMPLILVPLIWVALFFHACLDGKLARIAIVSLGLFAIHAGLIATKFIGPKPATVGKHR